MKYRFDKDDGIIDENGKQIIQLVSGFSCTKKERIRIGKILASALNSKSQEDITDENNK